MTQKAELNADDILQSIDDICSLAKQESSEITQNSAQWSEESLKSRGFIDEQIAEIRAGVEKGLPVVHYAKESYNWMQMREIRLGLLNELNTDIYENFLYNSDQMREIRMGLMDNLDVLSYAKLIYTATDMAKARHLLLCEKYKNNRTIFDKEWTDDESEIKIRIADNCLKAYIVLKSGNEYSVRQIKKILAKNDIVFGVDEEAIVRAVAEKIFDNEILIALGEDSKDGDDGKYEFFFKNELAGNLNELPDGKVDCEILFSEKMHVGDALAKYYASKEGQNGMTVTGVVIQSNHGKEKMQLSGKGFRFNPDTGIYFSEVNGFAVYDEERFMLNVWGIYEVDGDIDELSGNVFYSGIVHIKGSVSKHSVIEAEGSIVIDGFVENASLKSFENVIIKKGMNGKNEGAIVAGGNVIGEFFEGVKIQAHGNVEANYFLNCTVETELNVRTVGENGYISGGKINALCSVCTESVFNQENSSTLIEVGSVSRVEERSQFLQKDLESVNDELRRLLEGKNKLSRMIERKGSDENNIFHKTCLAIKIKEEQKQTLESSIMYTNMLIEKGKSAYIKVVEKLESGVKVNVHGNMNTIKSTLTGVKLT